MISTEKNKVESSHLSSYINPEFLRPHLSTKLYRTTFNYLKRFYSEQMFDEICHELQIPKSYLLSDDNWVSVEFGRRFADLVRVKTNDLHVYQKIGHFFFDAENINPTEYQILKMFSPFGFFKALPRFYKRTNQACDIEVKATGFGKYSIKIIPFDGTVYSDMVINTVGVLEGLKEFYKIRNFSIRLNQKIEPGEEVSQFGLDLEFSAVGYILEKLWGLFSIAGAGAALGAVLYGLEIKIGMKILPVLTALIVVLLGLLYSAHKGLGVLKKNIDLYYEKSREKNFQLYQKSELLDRRYREANLLKTLSTELITIKDPQKVMQVCLDSLDKKFEFNKVALFLVSKKRKKLFLSESRGLNDLSKVIGDVEFDFPNPNAKEGFFATILEKGNSALILDVEQYKEYLQPRNRKLLELIDVGSMVVCPIQTQDEKYGLLVAFKDKDQIALTPTDRFLAEKVCNFLALYLDNAANFEKELNLKNIFQQYVPSVVLEQFLRDGSDSTIALAPERINVVSVFIDLRGFTKMSEKISPEKVVQIISRYTDFISEIFAEQGAIIDNIVGDEVVMFLRCKSSGAEELVKFFAALESLSARWEQLSSGLNALGLQDFRLGVGAHIGPALVGTVGGNIKRNYTALGDTVNIASRLQSLSKEYESSLANGNLTVLVSSEVLAGVGENCDNLKSQHLRGRDSLTYFDVIRPSHLLRFCKENTKAA